MNEQQLQNLILDYLLMKGHFAWRNNTGAFSFESKGKKRYFRAGKKGSADILGVSKDGKAIAIEVKSPKRKLEGSPEQVQFLDEFNRRGGYGIMTNTLEQVQEVL